MGSITSAIADDEEEFWELVKEFNVKTNGFTYAHLYELRIRKWPERYAKPREQHELGGVHD